MSIYGSVYGSPLGLGRERGLLSSPFEAQYARWVIQTYEAMLNQLSSDYRRLANLNVFTTPQWAVDEERARYRAKARSVGGDAAYSAAIDARIARARSSIPAI